MIGKRSLQTQIPRLTQRFSAHPLLVIVSVSAAATFLMFIAYPPLDPASAWNDHFFYWGQANEWFGLGQPLVLTPEVADLLDRYRNTYYYDVTNGSGSQPPYVYRVAIPILAGVLGNFVPLWSAFLFITIFSLFLLGLTSGIAVYRLTGSLFGASLCAAIAVAAPGISDFTRFYAMVDAPAIAMTGLVSALLVYRKYSWALSIGALVAPLIKETSIGLGLFAAAVMWIHGRPGLGKWVMALIPFAIYGTLRLIVPVPSQPTFAELFIPGNPFEAGHSFLNAFGFAYLLAIGLLAPSVRAYSLASVPVFLILIVVTSSVVTSGPRIWLTAWPLLVILGLAGWINTAADRFLRWSVYTLLLSGVFLGNAVLLGLIDRIALTAWLVLSVGIVASRAAYLWRGHSSRGESHSEDPETNPRVH